MGQPLSMGSQLTVPNTEDFSALLLANPRCVQCGTNQALSIAKDGPNWTLYCDDHYPSPSPWKHLAGLVMPFEARRFVWHRDGGRCMVCGANAYITFDHVIPANRGTSSLFSGSNCETNL